MTWRVLPMVLGFCLPFFNYGKGNESHTELQRAKLVPVSMTGPGAVHQDETAAFGQELKYHDSNNSDIMLMNFRPRVRRRAEKKKKKHNTGALSPISMSQDGKKTHNTRYKREEKSKDKKTKIVKPPQKHEQRFPPKEKTEIPKRKQKKPQLPGVFSVLSYTSQDKERSGGQIEDLDD